MSPWIFLRFLFLPAMVVGGNLIGGWWNFTIPVVCFVIHPILNFFSTHDSFHHEQHGRSGYGHENKSSYRLIPLLFVPVMIALTAWAIIQIHNVSLKEFTGLVLSVGMINGILGFTLAHEFIHRHSRLEKVAGEILLIQNSYPHYGIEHVGGHHLYACTPKDPHSACLGVSFYQFLPRAIRLTFLNAWEIESHRLLRKKYRVFSIYNKMLKLIFIQFLMYALILTGIGWIPLLFFIFQAAVAILLLNITGYLQHYGLARKEIASGKFEKISAQHAWNSLQAKDGLNLFQVGKHADHHMHPSHSYEELVHHHDSPQQPTGYSGMIWLALVPPLWFRIMDKRIHSFNIKNYSI